MTGVAALAIFAAFTSCSKGEELYNPEVVEQNEIAQVYNSYNQAFILTFGQPAANHDWGFNTARTRGTRSENKKLNEWGDPLKNDGNPWDVPPALTERQKLRVRLYFQYNPNLTYIDPKFKDFFVQQVYKGNPTTKGPNSDEKYYRVNGDEFIGSDEMDHLVCGKDAHINDFNKGEWNLGTPLPVLNTGGDANLYKSDVAVEGVSHLDQITLMENSSTEFIGYGASTVEGEKRRDCCANAGAKAIDDWVASPEAQDLGISDFGDPVYDEKWNRSFVGLDYEAMKKADALSTESVNALDFKEDGIEFVLYKGEFININSFTNFVLKDKDNNEVKYLIDNVANEAVGERMKVDGVVNGQPAKVLVTKSTFNKKDYKSNLEATYNTTIDGNNEIRYLDLDMVINDYILKGCNPTKSDKNMVKNIGGRDYVFSDWIVTLTEANRVNIPTPPSDWDMRIMAEDLNAKAEDGDIENSDWDFNDVVIDVKFLGNDQVKICVVAAGGTLPLRINGEDELEVHKLYGKATNIMINTCRTEALQKKYPNHYNTSTYPEFTRTISGVDADNGRSIKLEVQKKLKSGELKWFEMEAKRGQPAAKFAVKTGVDYCNEREKISSKYSLFGDWVENAGDLIWWTPKATN